jgi:hypothetical protein
MIKSFLSFLIQIITKVTVDSARNAPALTAAGTSWKVTAYFNSRSTSSTGWQPGMFLFKKFSQSLIYLTNKLVLYILVWG